MEILRGKLLQIEEEKQLAEKRKLKGEHKIASWGNQIRSYVLHPYKMVKDLRTNYESSDPQAVLDGDLEGFIQAELKELF
jgi:peptide chain release factor 2